MFGNAEKEWVDPQGVGALPGRLVKVRSANGLQVFAGLFGHRHRDVVA